MRWRHRHLPLSNIDVDGVDDVEDPDDILTVEEEEGEHSSIAVAVAVGQTM